MLGKPQYLANHLQKRDDIQYTKKYPGIPGNTQEYPEILDSKKDTQKYLVIYFNTPTRPEPDPLPGIFSNTGPDQLLKNPTSWGLPVGIKVMNKTYTLCVDYPVFVF